MSRFVRELRGLVLGPVINLLANSKKPFEQSALYSVGEEKRFVDEGLRLSEFRTFEDAALFALIKDVVDGLSSVDPRTSFRLLENDITHIRYKTGGFFKKHADYLSLQSNVVEEYTLLLCVTPEGIDTRGGETRVSLNAVTVLTSAATVTRGCGLLFRKDLAHEGLPVIDGTKEIVSVNIWAMRKVDFGASLVHVRFKGALSTNGAANVLAKKSREGDNVALKSIADSRSYVVSSGILAEFPLCPLAGAVRFASANKSESSSAAAAAAGPGGREPSTAVGPASPLIIDYECGEDVSFEEFGTVFRALHGQYIRPSELVAHGHALDFFGIDLAQLLVEVVNAGNAGTADDETGDTDSDSTPAAAATSCNQCGASRASDGTALLRCSRCTTALYCSKKCQAAAWTAGHKKACKTVAALPANAHLLGLLGPSDESSPVTAPKNKDFLRTALATRGLSTHGDIEALRVRLADAEASVQLADEDVILCTTAERAAIVAAAAKALGLPYVPFRVMLAEGRIAYGGEMTGTPTAHLRMQPVWADVGDFGNLLYVRTIIHKGTQGVAVPHTQTLSFAKPPPIHRGFGASSSEEPSAQAVADHLKSVETFRLAHEACSTPGKLVTFAGYSSRKDSTFCELDNRGPGCWFGLLGAPSNDGKSPGFSTRNILDRLMRFDETEESDTLVILPGCEEHDGSMVATDSSTLNSHKRPRLDLDTDEGSPGADIVTEPPHHATASGTVVDSDSPMFHLDASGFSCFSADEALRASAHLASGGFLDHLVRRVNTTAFVLPQSRVENEAHFCNEAVYGKLNIVEMHGLVRLATHVVFVPPPPKSCDSESDSADEEEFNEELYSLHY